MRPRPLLLLCFLGLVPPISTGCTKPDEGPEKMPPLATSAPSSSPPRVPEAAPPPVASGASAPERPSDVIKTTQGDLRIVPIHHATVLFEFDNHAFYVDPFHEGNLDDLPKADFVFITHAHPDHFDLVALDKIRKPGTIIVAPLSVAEKLPPSSDPHAFAGTVVMKNGDRRTLGGDVHGGLAPVGVEAVPMYNLKRGPSPGKLFHDKGWGNGYVLTFGDKRIYLSCDTECTPEMRALMNIDVAFVCMNLPYTMPPSEAGACIDAFRPKILYPYHYRGSDLGELDRALARDKAIEVRKRDWY
jgi:L-ascorbate metabolism protein UlaG (beta-lactamase superfamily)